MGFLISSQIIFIFLKNNKNFKKAIDFIALAWYTTEKSQKEAVKMMNNKFYFYFYFFEKGCPSSVISKA